MKKKYSLTLDDEFIQYCELNKITDIEKLAKQTFNRGFTILKYGETPFIPKQEEPKINKENVVEKPIQNVPTPKKSRDLYGE